jgi:OTU domain-containing protein 3
MGPKPKSEDKSTGKKSLVVGKTRSSKKSNSYLAEDLNYKPFTTQLNKLGLQLRDITGDGNCCFRALSDQLEGAEGQHLEYRRRVCQYIRQNRDEFEPFIAALIEDDDADNKAEKKKPNRRLDAFDNYIRNLETPGTYADNGCLVAFARLYQVTINIHQLDLPIWTIQGVNPSKKNLHLAYHNGEHYSSIRRQGDTSNTPTEINFGSSSRNSSRGTADGQKLQQSRSASSSATFYVADEAMHESNVEQIMNVIWKGV